MKMKDFIKRNLAFWGVSIGTIILIIGGVFLFSRGGENNTERISDSILVSSDSQKTGGIIDGVYQPASPSAKVTIVEFADYQCPACAAYNPITQKLLTDFTGKVNFVYRNFPLSQHKNANISAYAAEAAGLSGKFWEMHDALYTNQAEWVDSDVAGEMFIKYAKDLGLDIDKFKTDIDSSTVKDKVSKDLNDGASAGINATPTYFVNGVKLQNPGSYEDFKKAVLNSF